MRLSKALLRNLADQEISKDWGGGVIKSRRSSMMDDAVM